MFTHKGVVVTPLLVKRTKQWEDVWFLVVSCDFLLFELKKMDKGPFANGWNQGNVQSFFEKVKDTGDEPSI